MITFRKVDIELLAEYKLDLKDIISTGITQNTAGELHTLTTIPISSNIDSLLKPIDCTIKDGLITNIPVVYKDNTFNLLN